MVAIPYPSPRRGAGGSSYDDTVIVQRVTDVETRVDAVEQDSTDYVSYDDNGNITAHYVLAGIMSDDGQGNYISDGGGIIIGGMSGVRYRHEGFYAHNDEGSIASYPQVANRANRLSLCPSGDPANIAGEDTASFALQHQNGNSEQRFVLVSKKAGEYRIASVATGTGVNFPITVAPGNYRTQRWEVNGSTTFTAEPISGAAAANTVVAVKNPAVSQFIRMFGRTSGEFGVEYVSGSGNLDYRFNNIGLGVGGFNANTHRFAAQVTETSLGGFYAWCSSATYTGQAYKVDVGRTADPSFSFFFARSNGSNSPDIEFNLRGDGNGYADGSWNANGADYAELFEWLDGNPDREDRVGRTVVLVGDKIRIAVAGEEPVGVISANPSVLGNAGWNAWQGKYLRDAFGRIEKDEEGNPVLNPAFDPELEYTPREERPEWSPVGLTGRLRVWEGQPTGSRWIKLNDINANVEEWLVR